jgi:hypothetical protein
MKRRRLVAAPVGLVLAALAAPARAYRPFDGTDADVADEGEFELELGPVHYYQEGQAKYLIGPATVLNLGIVPRVELVGDFKNTIPLEPGGGPTFQFNDTDVLLKGLVRKGQLQGEGGPSVAIEGGPLLPEVHGHNGFGASLNLIVSQRWSWLLIHVDNQLVLTRGDLRLGSFSGVIGEGRFGAPVRPVAELFGAWNPSVKTRQLSALAGAIWSVAPGLEVDAAVRVAAMSQVAAFEGRLGLTWTVAVWEPRSASQP